MPSFTGHPDVEFHARREGDEHVEIFHNWSDARKYLEEFAGRVDVVIWTEDGARAYGGSDAISSYKEDPDASVFERWARKDPEALFECQGKVP